MLSTLPADDDHPYRSGPWRPQSVEYDATELQVQGELPDDLYGVYLRNTENPLHPAIVRYHPFDGDAMIHKVSFRDGKVSYRNRFVRTDGLLAEQQARRSLWAGIAENPDVSTRPDGWGARGRMKDAASTDVIVHAGVAVASFWQCGDLYLLDPLTLDDLGKCSWGGSFPAEAGVSAHTKVDDHTGELLFFNYGTTAPDLHYGVVDASNRLVHYVPIDLPGPRPVRVPVPPGHPVPPRRHPAPRRHRRHPLVRDPAGGPTAIITPPPTNQAGSCSTGWSSTTP